MVTLPKLMYCFLSGTTAFCQCNTGGNIFLLPVPRDTQCMPSAFLVLCDDLFMLGRTHSCDKGCGCVCTGIDRCRLYPTGSAMTIQYFSLGMMHARYPYCCSLAKWVDFSTVNAPPSSFSRVLMDLGVMISVIFVMASFWATSISYTPFLDNFDDILASTLLEREVV
jgi:hypothetical protein